MAGLIVAVFAASFVVKDLVTARNAAIGTVSFTACYDLLQQYHPVPLLLACGIGFFPVWGSFVLIRKASFALLVPAVILVMMAGSSLEGVHDLFADWLDMQPKRFQ